MTNVEIIKSGQSDRWGEYDVYYSSLRATSVSASVLLSVKNQKKQFLQACESLRQQTLQRVEFVVIDDGSNEDISNTILQLMEEDPRWILIKQENRGLTISLFRGSHIATGEYIARQDADDLSHPERLEKQYGSAKQLKADIVFCRARIETTDKTCSAPSYFLMRRFKASMFIFGNLFVHGTLFIRTEVLRDTNYDPSLRYAQDYDLYCRLLSKNLNWAFLKECLYTLRQDGQNISTSKFAEQTELAKNICKKYFGSEHFFITDKSKLFQIFLKLLRISMALFSIPRNSRKISCV